VYRPIARESVNAPLGLTFDLVSGIVMAILFVALTPALPGGWVHRGIAFGLIAWFFRVAMGSASQAVMFRVPASALFYALLTGLAEMIAPGLALRRVLKAQMKPQGENVYRRQVRCSPPAFTDLFGSEPERKTISESGIVARVRKRVRVRSGVSLVLEPASWRNGRRKPENPELGWLIDSRRSQLTVYRL